MFSEMPTVCEMSQFLKEKWHQLMHKAHQQTTAHYPRFHQLLPYRFVDKDADFFIQENSIGFGFELAPLSGVNESIINGLHDLLRLKCNKQDIVQCLLISSNQCLPLLNQGLNVGHETNTLETLQHLYMRNALKKGFSTSSTIKTGLKDYRLFLFFARPGMYNASTKKKLLDHRASIQASLEAMNLSTLAMVTSQRLAELVFELMSLSPNKYSPTDIHVEPYVPLNEQCDDRGFELQESVDQLHRSRQENSKTDETIIQALEVKKYPQSFALSQGADCFAPILERSKAISCPFVINWQMRLLDQEKTKSKSARKYRKNQKNFSAGLSKFFPSLGNETNEWDMIRTQLEQDKISLVKVQYNLVLFSTPDAAQEDLEAARATFLSQGFELATLRYLQKNAYLSFFPFVGASGFFDDFSIVHQTKTMTSFNAVNLMPLCGDAFLSKNGLLIPTFRQQCCFFNLFDESLPISNFNMCVAGIPGAGKSFFVNSVIFDAFKRGGYVFVLDKGDSYKKLCHLIGGAYLSAENLQLNPFTHVTDIQKKAEPIRDLLVMAISPNKDIDEISQEYLRAAVVQAFHAKKQSTRIDDVVHALKQQADATTNQCIKHLIILLGRYTSTGDMPHILNDASPISPTQRFVVLELSGLTQMPKKLKAVTFALLQYVQDRFFQLPRDVPKVLLAEEVAQMLSKEHGTEDRFLQRFFNDTVRTSRKYRASTIFVTQNLDDYAQSAGARAIFANSSFKVIFSQEKDSMGEFLKWQAGDQGQKYFTPFVETIVSSFGLAKVQGFSDFMLLMKEHVSFHHFFTDPFSKILFSSHATEFEMVSRLQAKGLSMEEAVIQAAKHFYPEEVAALMPVTKIKEEVAA